MFRLYVYSVVVVVVVGIVLTSTTTTFSTVAAFGIQQSSSSLSSPSSPSSPSSAVTTTAAIATTTTTTVATTSRADFLQSIVKGTVGMMVGTTAVLGTSSSNTMTAANAATTTATATTPTTIITLPNGVMYTVLKQGTGPQPTRGELVAIRFAAYNGDTQIDNVFDSPEPYYTRVGSGGLLPGVETTLPLMQLGDRWKMTIPSELAFGKKGRPSSAGKARIPGDATIVFDVEMVGLPGKEPELIDLIGDV